MTQPTDPTEPGPSLQTPESAPAAKPAGTDAKREQRQPFWAIRRNGWTVRGEDLAGFTHNLGRMLQAGLPLIQALQRLQMHTRNPKLRVVVSKLQADVQTGLSLTEALSKHPEVFDPFYVQAIELGERTGQIEIVLQRLTSLHQWKGDIQKRLIGLLIYPIFVVLVLILVGTVFIGFVLPIILNATPQSNQPLPLGAQILLVFRNYWFLIAMGLFGLWAGAMLFFEMTTIGQRIRDEFLLAVPVVSGLVKGIQATNFLYGMHLAYEAGLSMDLAFILSSRTINNSYLQEVFAGLSSRIEAGEPLGLVLAETDCLPGLVLESLDIGEESGQLGKMLQDALTTMTTQVDDSINLLLRLLQPVAMLCLTLFMGCFLLLFFFSIFEVIGHTLLKATTGKVAF